MMSRRKYKAGYVWEDLMDDDLVTPISDNEYVLKGCDVRRTPPPRADDGPKPFPIDEKKPYRKGSWEQKQVEEVLQVQVTRDYDKSSPKPPPPTDQDDSPYGDQATPFRIVLPHDLQQRKQRRQREAAARGTATEKQQQAVVVIASRAAAAGPGGERHKQQRPAVGRARRMRVAQVLHSILTCGAAADAVDDAVVLRRSAGAIDDGEDGDGDGWQRTPVCPGMDGCGIHMSRKVKLHQRGGKDSKAKRDGGRRDRVAAAHKPATLPRCSQCGKQFKPQELHSHMQSCRGLRERMRSSAASAQFSVDRNRS
uniref:Uncharacterized protein n=1 Tax=Avena sativa TaxID=4498 RepID=A0ACD5VTI8_AVESA